LLPFSDADTHHRSFPVVNVSLIGISALVFLYELAISGFGVIGGGDSEALTEFFFTWGFIPEELTRGEPFSSLLSGFGRINIETPTPTWTTIFSSLFMHGGLMHFAGNMMFLWVFGDNIEDRMGHVKYLVFYSAAGVVATLSHWLIDPGSSAPLIGASGAIAGVLGAYLFTYPYNRVKVLVIFFLITVIQLRAMWLLAIWFGWQLIQGALSIGISDQVSVAFFAHIGGFVFGAGVIVLYRLATRQPVWPARYSLAPPSPQFWRGRPLD